MLVLALHTYIHTYKLTFVSFFMFFFAPFPKKTTLYLVTICDLSKNIMCLSIILGMPPKADYWRYFNVVGVVAYCLIAECLAWWEKMEPSLVAKGPAGAALVALAKR